MLYNCKHSIYHRPIVDDYDSLASGTGRLSDTIAEEDEEQVAAEEADDDGKGDAGKSRRNQQQQRDATLTGRMLLFPVEDVLCSLYPAIAYACQQGLRSRRDAVSMFLAVPQRDRDKPHAFEHIGQFGASPLLFGGGGLGGGAPSHHSGPPRSVRLSAGGGAGAGSQHSSRSGHSSSRSAGDGNAHGHKPSSLKGGAGAAGATAALSATGGGGVSRAPSAGGGSVAGSMAGTSRRGGGNMGAASSTLGAGGRVMTAGGSTIGADGVRVLAMTEANLNPQAAQAAAAAQVQHRTVPKMSIKQWQISVATCYVSTQTKHSGSSIGDVHSVLVQETFLSKSVLLNRLIVHSLNCFCLLVQSPAARAHTQTLFLDATAQLKQQLAQRELDRFGREQRRAKRLEAIGAQLEAAQQHQQHAH